MLDLQKNNVKQEQFFLHFHKTSENWRNLEIKSYLDFNC